MRISSLPFGFGSFNELLFGFPYELRNKYHYQKSLLLDGILISRRHFDYLLTAEIADVTRHKLSY